MKRLLTTLVTVVGLGVSLAIGQQLIQQTLTGSEAVLIQAGGPGGTGFFTNTAGMKNGTIYASIAVGGTVTTTVSPNVRNVIVTGAITTLNLSMPVAPFDGQTVQVSCPGGAITTVTLSPTTPAVMKDIGGGFVACATSTVASLSATYTFMSSPVNAWERVQ